MNVIKKWYRGGMPTFFIFGENETSSNGLNKDLINRILDIKYNSINDCLEVPEGFNDWRREFIESRRKDELSKDDRTQDMRESIQKHQNFMKRRFLNLN